MEDSAVNIAKAPSHGLLRSLTIDFQLPGVACRNVFGVGLPHLPNERQRHVMISRPQDREVQQPAKDVERLARDSICKAWVPSLVRAPGFKVCLGGVVLVAVIHVPKGLLDLEGLVLWPDVDRLLEQLDHRVVVQGVDGVGHPVRVQELDVAVDPGHVAPPERQALRCHVDEVLLDPELL